MGRGLEGLVAVVVWGLVPARPRDTPELLAIGERHKFELAPPELATEGHVELLLTQGPVHGIPGMVACSDPDP